MAMASIPIIVDMSEEELAVEVGMDIPCACDMAVADVEVGMAMPDIDMLSIFDVV